jgi:DNA invertase Pin-like site-specific DNA recombinase
VARLAAGRQIKAGQQPHDRKQGGKLPHGYRRANGSVEIDPDAADEVRRVFALVRGGKSIRQVAAMLGWQPTVVARIVRRDVYKREHPARIVSPAIWNAAQDALARRRKNAA